MRNSGGSYALAVIFSLVFHGGLIVVLTHGWEASEPERRPMPKFVQAKLVSADAMAPRKKTPPKRDLIQERERREQERQRREQAEKERRAAAEKKKKAEAEKKRKAEIERKKKAAEEQASKERQRKEKERREQLERERQSAFEEALEEEDELLDAREGAQAVMSVAQAIQQRIESAWSQPPSARNGMVAEVEINFVPTGRVVAASISKSSGNAALDRSVVTAVRKVEVFPEVAELAREEPALFEREVRNTKLIFRVEGLRQ